ncbi:MAG: MFS transporter, partial [Chloroflexi bacterium]|nr:MFS transporter [Chloroflexota bacterium]
APTLTGLLIAATANKTFAILSISITAWMLSFFLYLGALFTVDHDIKTLRSQMAERAKQLM